jgi:energy-coupling factor transporter ATP-binding protein EcfA2
VLELSPEPGLTVVAGSNGSGKSSFAEALELLMTGAVKRWTKRPRAWTDAWQCLPHDGPTRLAAELENGCGVITLERTWARGAPYQEASPPAHDWTGALGSFRPFLSYAELATMFVTLTHDDRLPEAIDRLAIDATLVHVDRRPRSSVAVGG